MGTGLETRTHTQEVEDNGGGLEQRVETRCEQLGGLPRERRETLCPLEAGCDQVDSVVPREVEGKSAANGCTPSLGGMETPGALVVARVPSVSVVPVCVVTSVPVCVSVSAPPSVNETLSETTCVSGVVTSVPECVLSSTPCVRGAPQAEEAACAQKTARVCGQPACVSETPRVSAAACVGGVVCVSEARVSERPSVRKTACVRSLCVREMAVAMREHAAASPGVSLNVMSWCASLVTRGSLSARVERRRRLRHLSDKSRVAAVVSFGTVPGLHGSERVVRAVQRRRPPRARLRG